MVKGKTIHRKIRNLEESITRDLNPALEKAARTGAAIDQAAALEKIELVIKNAKLIRAHVRRDIRRSTTPPPTPGAAAS